MSAGCEKSTSRAIPTTRRVTVHEAAHMPQDYCTTPGGTLFSTTPGGTRIIYDRKFLLDCRTSPVARTPPRCLPDIPGVTSPPSATINNNGTHQGQMENNNSTVLTDKTEYWQLCHQFIWNTWLWIVDGHPFKHGAILDVRGEDAQFEMDI